MDTSAMVVAVLFGAAMGAGLARFLDDRRPLAAALAFGLLLGGAVTVFELTADPVFVGRSLLLGCGAAGVAVLAVRRPSGRPSPRS